MTKISTTITTNLLKKDKYLIELRSQIINPNSVDFAFLKDGFPFETYNLTEKEIDVIIGHLQITKEILIEKRGEK